MSSGFLALNYRNGSPFVLRYVNGTTVQVGNVFGGPAETSSGSTEEITANRVCQFKGSNDLYAHQRGTIHQYNSGTGNWTGIHTIGTPNTATRHLGPYVLHINNQPTMVAISPDGTSYQAATSTDGSSWVNASAVNIPGAGGGYFYSPIVWRNQIYWLNSGDAFLYAYDPVANTYQQTLATGALDSRTMYATAIFNDRFFLLGLDAGSQSRTLAEFTGSSIVTAVNAFNGVLSSQTNNLTKDCLFTDGDDLYAVFYDTPTGGSVESAGGVNCWQFDGALSPTDLTTTVIPTSIRSGQGTGSGTKRGTRIRALIDAEANPGSTPDIFLYISQAGGGPGNSWSVYEWNGDAALIGNSGAANDIGGDVSHALNFEATGNGKRFWTEDELDISIELLTPVLGAEEISFRLYSPSGTETVKVSFFFDTDGETSNTLCTLQNASAGTIVSNEITGLTANNGATLYTVEWDAPTDGLSQGQRTQLTGLISL